MPTDHPDGTRAIVISRADIQTPVDFQHQGVNVETDFKAQSVGVYGQPDWATLQGIDKNVTVFTANKVFGERVELEYVVPANKTLYVTQIFFANKAYNAADANNNQICDVDLYSGANFMLNVGANGGGSVILPKTCVVEGGTTIYVYCYNRANHASSPACGFAGYEISD